MIDLEPDTQLSLRLLYRLSEYELEILREYLNECLRTGFIRPSKAATGAPVLFTPKKDESVFRFIASLSPQVLDRHGQHATGGKE